VTVNVLSRTAFAPLPTLLSFSVLGLKRRRVLAVAVAARPIERSRRDGSHRDRGRARPL